MSDNSNDTKNIVLGIIAVISLVAIVAKLLKKSEEEEQQEKADKSRQKLYNTVSPSYNDFMYKDWADALEMALLKKSDEDEDAVYTVFGKLKNISDINKLIEAFGHRRLLFTTLYISLPTAIGDLFSAGEKIKLNNIISKNGISYSF